MVCLPRICEYTIKYMQVYLCVHMCGVCLSVCFVHVCACLDKCECVYVGALCACVMTLCPGLSAVLPPSPGALSPSSCCSPPAGHPPPSSLPGELPQPLVASGTVSRPTIPGPPSPARPHSGAPDPNSQSTLGSSPVSSKLTVPLTRPAPPSIIVHLEFQARTGILSSPSPHVQQD